MRILYVEDNPDDADLVRRYLSTTEHELVIATSITGAVEALPQGFDIILLDMMINNRRTGYDFARDLKSQGYNQPLIAVTGLSTPSDVRALQSAGVDDILTKPYTINQLADVIQRYS